MNEAINRLYPETEHQLCSVRQVRNNCKYVSYKEKKNVCADLKNIYSVPTIDFALT